MLLASCASTPSVPVVPELNGTWVYAGGLPADDALLDWATWPDAVVTIDAARGEWRVTPRPGAGRTVLPTLSRVVAIVGNVLTLVPSGGGRTFQIYWRLVDDHLEYWYGDHADWLKPRVVFRRS